MTEGDRQRLHAVRAADHGRRLVLARELGIPAVIGAPDALISIANGVIVDVDPLVGEVRVVADV